VVGKTGIYVELILKIITVQFLIESQFRSKNVLVAGGKGGGKSEQRGLTEKRVMTANWSR